MGAGGREHAHGVVCGLRMRRFDSARVAMPEPPVSSINQSIHNHPMSIFKTNKQVGLGPRARVRAASRRDQQRLFGLHLQVRLPVCVLFD